MKLSFLQQLQRLTGLATGRILLAGSGPERVASEQLMEYLLAELPDLLMAAVVEISTGDAWATYSSERDYRTTAVVGYNAEVIRQIQALLRAQRQADEALDEILITLPSQVHLLRLLPDQKNFVYLAVDSHDTNLAIAREVLRSGLELLQPVAPAVVVS